MRIKSYRLSYKMRGDAVMTQEATYSLQSIDEPDTIEPETCCELVPGIDGKATDVPETADDGLESVRPWRVAEALKALREQVNAAAPRRGKLSDGAIGDAAHITRASDHNPWVVDGALGVVTAVDITHDPAGGCDSYRLADVLRKSRDPRIKYVISHGRIATAAPKGSVPGWTWRTYTGPSPHDHHCHISVQPTKALYDSRAKWAIADAFGPRLESAFDAAADVPSDTSASEMEYALQALAADSGDAARPLLPRLIALQDAADMLVLRYNAAVRAPGEDPGEIALEATAPRFADLADEYRRLYASCTIAPDKVGLVAWHRRMLLKGRPRYDQVAARTGVPWWFIGIVHAMEASFNFAGHLHNGDPLTARTVHVPPGRPTVWNPPSDWTSSALDALALAGFAGQNDWSLAHALFRWEAYNGWGYRRLNVHTPYLWSFSNHHTKGKFVKDRVYDPNAISKQCGAAVMLKTLQDAGDVRL